MESDNKEKDAPVAEQPDAPAESDAPIPSSVPSKSSDENTPTSDDQAPADALSRTPEDLEKEHAETIDPAAEADRVNDKKLSPLRRVLKRVNVYFLGFLLLVAVAGVILLVNYLNVSNAPQPSVASQSLSQDQLKQLANTDVSVGSASQTLTIQGNAIITGQTLARGNLNVAGALQSAGSITGPSITIAGNATLGGTQVNTLQVASTATIQGTTTLHDVNIAGATSLSGPVTASQLTVTQLIMSGNAVLQIPNHIRFTGSSPSRTLNNAVLGSGGSAAVSGSDTSGTITVNTGNGPTAGCMVHITFQQVYTTQPRVIATPIDAGAGQVQYYIERTTSGFSLCSDNAPPANQTFSYDFFVAG